MAVMGSGWQWLARRNENITLSYVRLRFNFDPLQDYMHAHGLDLKPAAVETKFHFYHTPSVISSSWFASPVIRSSE
jgi:hypothetical protein